MGEIKHPRITKVTTVHPEGGMNGRTKFHVNPLKIFYSISQKSTMWWKKSQRITTFSWIHSRRAMNV